MTFRQWEKAQRLGIRCSATRGEGKWQARCSLPPGHDGPHEDWRGYGSVVFAEWPAQPAEPQPAQPLPPAS